MKEWVIGGGANLEVYSLKLPSGKRLEVVQILGIDGEEYTVIEASLWVELVKDVLKKPGKLRVSVKEKLVDFLAFLLKLFYAVGLHSLHFPYLARVSGIHHSLHSEDLGLHFFLAFWY